MSRRSPPDDKFSRRILTLLSRYDKRQFTLAVLPLLIVLLTALPAASAEIAGYEQKTLSMRPVYPEPSTTILDSYPCITIDTTALQPSIDTDSARIMINGVDVTADADITPAYIMYEPADRMKSGDYQVKVTARNLDQADVEPLVWSFSILTPPSSRRTAQAQGDNTTGSYVISTDYISAKYDETTGVDVASTLREKDGVKVNTDMTFINTSEGRTVKGSFHRETRDYTDIEKNQARLDYTDSKFSATLGTHWADLGDLSLAGAEIDGATVLKNIGKWNFAALSGRTHDPDNGGYSQWTSALKTDYLWNRSNRSSFSALTARESGKQIAGYAAPARNDILSLAHTSILSPNVTTALEYATSRTRPRDTATSDDEALLAKLSTSYSDLNTSLECYNTGRDFQPISDGGARYLRNNREGCKLDSTWRPFDSIRIDTGFERYDYATGTITPTSRRSASAITWSRGALNAFTLRYSRLSSFESLTVNKGLSTTYIIPDTSFSSRTRLTLSAQNIKFRLPSATSDSDVKLFVFSSVLFSNLSLSTAFSRNDSSTPATGAYAQNDNTVLTVNWETSKNRNLVTLRYENSTSQGSAVDNREQRHSVKFTNTLKQQYRLGVEFENLRFRDRISSVFNYRQNIMRLSVEKAF